VFLHCVLFLLDFPKNSATQEDTAIANSLATVSLVEILLLAYSSTSQLW